jgi:hypothetical protein
VHPALLGAQGLHESFGSADLLDLRCGVVAKFGGCTTRPEASSREELVVTRHIACARQAQKRHSSVTRAEAGSEWLVDVKAQTNVCVPKFLRCDNTVSLTPWGYGNGVVKIIAPQLLLMARPTQLSDTFARSWLLHPVLSLVAELSLVHQGELALLG